jgi:hypothetical protein
MIRIAARSTKKVAMNPPYRDASKGTAACSLTKQAEGKTMHVAAKRAIVAAAAVAAAGLYGSLSYDGQMVAQSGVPTVHHDVALVDGTSPLSDVTELAAASGPTAAQTTFLTAENVFNDEAYKALFGPGGFEASLYTGLGANANNFLDTTNALGASGIFDGATSQYFDGVYADGLLGEDYLNQALGISSTASETSILAQLANDPFVDPTGTATTGEEAQILALEGLTPGASAGTFDGDLAGLAQAFYTQSFTDLTGYETYLSNNMAELTSAGFSLDSILTSVTTDLSNAVSGLSTDFTTFTTALDTLLGF